MKPLLLCSLLALALSAAAQEKKKDKKYHHSFEDMMPVSVIGLGPSFQKFNGLNDRVGQFAAFKELPEQAGSLQLGWLKQKDRIIAASDIGLGSNFSGDRGKRSSNIRYIGIGADAGYDLLKDKRMILYPFVGIGYEWYQARFFTDNSALSFDEILANPGLQNEIRPVNFRNDFFTYRVGLGFTINSPKNPDAGIGLKLGYTGSFNEQYWKTNEHQNLGDAPSDKLGRFYVSLLLTHQMRMMGMKGNH